jgi:hypothetical protein
MSKQPAPRLHLHNSPLPQNVKIPIDAAISQVGRASGLNPLQAHNTAVATQFGLQPAPAIINPIKTK